MLNLPTWPAGRKFGRMSEDELVIFDSSGSGVQDVATAWSYREGRGTGIGGQFDLPEAAMEQ
jgi:ornithine cyclodeaminase/alanine dehydrogenase-like protein (mu-crystallin family)